MSRVPFYTQFYVLSHVCMYVCIYVFMYVFMYLCTTYLISYDHRKWRLYLRHNIFRSMYSGFFTSVFFFPHARVQNALNCFVFARPWDLSET